MMGHSQSTRRSSSEEGRVTPSATTEDDSTVDNTTQPILTNEANQSDMEATPTFPDETTTPSQPELPTQAEAMAQDADIILLKTFLNEGLNNEANSPTPINRVLASSARVLAKFPSDVIMVTSAVLPRCYDLLPVEPSSHVMEIQMNALEAFSQLGISSTPSLVKPAMDMLRFFWTKYPTTLPACCNIKQLADVLNAALQLESKEDAVRHANSFVVHLVNLLSDSQLEALEKEGVYKSLRSLLHHYDSIDAMTLRHIIAGVGIFANVKAAANEILEENLYPIFILSAQKFATDVAFQKVIWPLLILLCIRDKAFALAIAEMGAISSALSVIQTEGASLMPVFKFITSCCQIDSIFYSHCLDNSDLIEHLFGVIESNNGSVDSKNNCADFIALICTKAPRKYLSRLIELKLVRKLEDICQTQPDVAVIPIYLAIEGLVGLLSQEQAIKSPNAISLIDDFYAMDHHLFLQQALSNPIVYSNQSFLEVIYLSLQKLLKLITTDAMQRMCSKEFLEVYSISFVRDTISFPALANRVVFASHFFVFQMRKKEPIELLREVGFHLPVVELVSNGTSDIISTVLGLLSCLISKFFEFLKDVKPLLDANVPSLILQKAAVYGKLPHSSFGDEMSRILLNLTSEKELSLKLYKDGFLEQLLANLNNSYTPVVKKCIVHAIGNIALAGQNVKEVLFKESFHTRLLSMLSIEAEKGDPNYLSACCRVLHILASGDAAKRDFVDNGCVPLLIKILKSRKDNPEICWRPLGLLSALGFMAILNRHCILTKDVMEVVVKILREEKHGKVLGYTMLVFLAYLQLDSGAASMRQMAIEDRIREVYRNPDYQKQSSEIERWGKHVLENQDLYTVATPTQTTPPCSSEDCRVSNWPYEYSSAGRNLLPLEDVYFEPKTPIAIQLTPDAKEQLRHLQLDPDLPIFRVGRVYGCTYGWCSNCDKEGASYELVIRVQSMTPMQYQHLIDNGWYRRGGVKMFRMMHNHSTVCCDWETRVSVAQFDFNSHKSYKKILRRMPKDRLTIETLPRHFSREAFDLYNSYHIQRHEKPQKSEFSYCEHVVDSPLANQTIDGVEYGTFHQMYRLDGKLVAIGIVDVVPKGMVSIYMWYDVSKEVAKLSFGVYSALKEIKTVRERRDRDPTVEYYYLQGWNSNNHKLSYKANYEPEEFYCPSISTNWVASKDKVNEEMERYRQEKEGPEETMDTAAATADTIEQTDSAPHEDKPTEVTKEAAKDEKTAPSEATKDKEETASEATNDKEKTASEATKDKEKPSIPCDAVDMDRLKHKKLTGSDSVDVANIVVCLNYTQYMRLGELFERGGIGREQKEMMEKRYEELLLALCPELTSQLVIDLRACIKDGAMQIKEDVGVSVDPPTSVDTLAS